MSVFIIFDLYFCSQLLVIHLFKLSKLSNLSPPSHTPHLILTLCIHLICFSKNIFTQKYENISNFFFTNNKYVCNVSHMLIQDPISDICFYKIAFCCSPNDCAITVSFNLMCCLLNPV